MSDNFTVKDSGERETFASGMIRDTTAGKIEYDKIYDGPMADRWADHLTKGAAKYPDLADGTPNWMQANGPDELRRFRKSAMRHFRQWMRGDRDEDHAAAVFFNVNGYEFVRDRMERETAARVPLPAPLDPKRIVTWPDEPGKVWEYVYRGEWQPESPHRCTADRDKNGDLILYGLNEPAGALTYRFLSARDAAGGRGGFFALDPDDEDTRWRLAADQSAAGGLKAA